MTPSPSIGCETEKAAGCSLVCGSVCSGIGAPEVAWKPLGWRFAFASEIEPFPRAVHKHHHPEIPLHGDFTTIGASEYEPIDLLVGGTPCQSFSIAGLRGGLDDDRGNLALEYLRLADRLRPRWLVWENVPGVLSSNSGRDFGAILGGMVELGYGIAYRVLDAQFFGVAQRRRRVFVVGYLGDWRRAAAVLFERHSLSGHPAPRREAGQTPSPTISARPSAGGGLGTDFDLDGGLIAKCLSASHTASHTASGRQDPSAETYVTHSLRGEGFDASEDGTGRGIPLIVGTLNANGKAAGSATQQDAEGDPCHPLAAMAHPPVIAFSSKDHGADAEHDLSPTLRAGSHDASHANAGAPPAIAFALRGREGGAMPEVGGDVSNALRTPGGGASVPMVSASAVRRLTPLECERLQGFPDGYTAVPWRKRLAPDGPRYKALGNSMAVPCMAWIGRRIAAVDAIFQARAVA